MANDLITVDTPISEAMNICSGASDVFIRHGMGCYECLAANAETVGDGAEMHGVDPQALVDELNAACGL